MAYTQLSPTATPGRRYSFSAKESAAVAAVGICSVTFAAKQPDISCVAKQPDVGYVAKQPKVSFEA